ncbi:MAG: SDR family oxidoreductase [Anaerolineales bacterium]|nr:SDR family oxidoreductase [Anaerolineales bacterium]
MMSAAQQQKFALITGAAGGIGRALVHEFATNGYAVIATDQTPQPANMTCAHYLQADLARTVTDEAYAEEIFSQIKTWLGKAGLAALINNAAVQILGGADSLTRSDWQQTLNVNLVAPFIWTQALLPALEHAKGSVVNISSIHAKLTKKNFVAYATSKAALSGMTRALAVDVGPRVRVNAIEPAAIATDMLKAGFEGKRDLYQQLENCHPQLRIGQTEEVARLALAIVDGGMDFLHGACVGIDGGISARLFDPD